MKLHVNKKTDACICAWIIQKIIDSREVSPGIILHFNSDDQVVGIEMLNLSHRTPQLDLDELQYKSA